MRESVDSSEGSQRRERAAIAAQACQTCRNRKSKCDEQRPKCGQSKKHSSPTTLNGSCPLTVNFVRFMSGALPTATNCSVTATNHTPSAAPIYQLSQIPTSFPQYTIQPNPSSSYRTFGRPLCWSHIHCDVTLCRTRHVRHVRLARSSNPSDIRYLEHGYRLHR